MEYLKANVNVNPPEVLLKNHGVLTILLTLFLFSLKLAVLSVNVNVAVTFFMEIYYLVVNVNECSPLFSIWC